MIVAKRSASIGPGRGRPVRRLSRETRLSSSISERWIRGNTLIGVRGGGINTCSCIKVGIGEGKVKVGVDGGGRGFVRSDRRVSRIRRSEVDVNARRSGSPLCRRIVDTPRGV